MPSRKPQHWKPQRYFCLEQLRNVMAHAALFRSCGQCRLKLKNTGCHATRRQLLQINKNIKSMVAQQANQQDQGLCVVGPVLPLPSQCHRAPWEVVSRPHVVERPVCDGTIWKGHVQSMSTHVKQIHGRAASESHHLVLCWVVLLTYVLMRYVLLTYWLRITCLLSLSSWFLSTYGSPALISLPASMSFMTPTAHEASRGEMSWNTHKHTHTQNAQIRVLILTRLW